MSIIPPIVSLYEIPQDQPCQEAHTNSGLRYFPCGKPAIAIIDNGDDRPYYMCLACAMHNLRNRRASIIFSSDGVLRKMMKDGSVKVKKVPPKPKAVKEGEGWTRLANSSRWHYFRNRLALCGEWELPSVGTPVHLSPEATAELSCRACLTQLETEQSKETPNEDHTPRVE